MNVRIYCLFAAMKGEHDPSPWMIAAEDEFSWEGDPQRCERVFQTARDFADRNNWECREVVLLVSYAAIAKQFVPNEIDAEVASDA